LLKVSDFQNECQTHIEGDPKTENTNQSTFLKITFNPVMFYIFSSCLLTFKDELAKSGKIIQLEMAFESYIGHGIWLRFE
jgi:hypothetical protein